MPDMPPDGSTLDAGAIHEHLAAEVLRTAERDARSISVDVDRTRVTLRGTVSNLCVRHLVEDSAWALPGVDVVDNELTVR